MTARILIIDDEHIYSHTIAISLSAKGYEPIIRNGGLAGLDYLANHANIDLILLDLMMPDMYGLDVLNILKNTPKLRDIPVVIQTGIQDDDEITRGLNLGAECCLRKPFLIKHLLETVAQVLSTKKECLTV